MVFKKKYKSRKNLIQLIKSKISDCSEREISLVLCQMGDFNGASKILLNYIRQNRPLGQPEELSPTAFSKTNKIKLFHDINQINFLRQEGFLSSKFENLANVYLEVLQTLPKNLKDEEYFDIPKHSPQEFLKYYNQLIYLHLPNIKHKDVLNPKLNWAALDTTFCERLNNTIVADDILTEKALAELYKFCLLSTIWVHSDSPKDLYSNIFTGFACPLIFQIAHQLRQHLPQILNKYSLIDAWVFKYLGNGSDLGIHGDRGEIAINFWITPDTANLMPDTGGLRIWNQPLPKDYFDQSREKQKILIEKVLANPKTKSTSIIYKCNRAIIFKANLAHQTEAFTFSQDYVNHRMNVTLLFG